MFNFFKSGRNKQPSHRQVSTEEYLSQITHSSGAVGWGTVDHDEPDNWAEYRQRFQDNAEAFLSATHPDKYNDRYLDREIRCYQELAIAEDKSSRVRNMRSRHNIKIYQEACLLELDLAIAQLEETLNEYEKEALKC